MRVTDLAEDDVIAFQPRRRHAADEELKTIVITDSYTCVYMYRAQHMVKRGSVNLTFPKTTWLGTVQMSNYRSTVAQYTRSIYTNTKLYGPVLSSLPS
jgi:hypothetical protein